MRMSLLRALPDGYDTLVGERGMRLSGGERQRIALARAFLKDAPILILDEPTSAIDVKTEALIMEAMQRVMAGRTTLMIAHRLSTLDVCDARIVLDHGRLCEASGRDAGSCRGDTFGGVMASSQLTLSGTEICYNPHPIHRQRGALLCSGGYWPPHRSAV